MSDSNLFETATRTKLRFASDRGDLTVEQLWDLPLQHKSGFDLDNLAKAVNSELKASSEESFVSARSPASEILSLKLEILKRIIAVKQKEQADAKQAAERRAELTRLTSILAEKQDEALKGLSVEQLQERIKALSGA